MKLLDYDDERNSRAFALASIGLLMNYSISQLLNIYLSALDMQLNMMLNKPLQEISIPNIVIYLQNILLDTWFMFFRHHSEKSTDSKCMLIIYEDFIINGVFSSVKNFSVVLDKNYDTCSMSNEEVISDFDADKHLLIFDKWLEKLKIRISSKCNDILEKLHRNSEISKLQQSVHKASTSINIPSSRQNLGANLYTDFEYVNQNVINLSQYDYAVAYNYLLNPKTRGRRQSAKVNFSNNKEIWDFFFLSCFQQQILKMLQKSCESSVLKMQSLLTFDLAHTSVSNRYNMLNSELSSKHLFNESEALLVLIQSEFKGLFEALFDGHGPSVDIFSFGLYVVSTHLSANLIILFRCAVSKVSVAMKELNPTDPKFKSYLTSLLLIGRLAYMIVNRFDFFSSLFEKAQFSRFDGETNLPWSAFGSFSYLDDVSIKSAFEIADSNGDGLLSFTEYREALSALGNVPISNEKFDSVSLLEFTMLCSHFSLVKVNDSLSKFKMSMSTLIIHSQNLWALYASKKISLTWANDALNFKTVHHHRQEDLDDIIHRSQAVSIHNVSRTLTMFLFLLSHQFYTGLVSIDTLHAMNKSISSEYTDIHGLDSYYLNLLSKNGLQIDVLKNVFENGLLDSALSSVIFETITIILDKTDLNNQNNCHTDDFPKSIDEHLCSQMIFDMISLELIIKNISTKFVGNNFSELLISIRARKSQFYMHLNHTSKNILLKEFDDKATDHLSNVALLIGLFSPDKANLKNVNDNKTATIIGLHDQALQHTFSSYKSNSRFSLLPLPLRYS